MGLWVSMRVEVVTDDVALMFEVGRKKGKFVENISGIAER